MYDDFASNRPFLGNFKDETINAAKIAAEEMGIRIETGKRYWSIDKFMTPLYVYKHGDSTDFWRRIAEIKERPSDTDCITDSIRNQADAALIAIAPDMYSELAAMTSAAEEMQDMMRRNGFVIDDLDDRWQKLAFTLYSKIVSMSSRAAAVVARANGDD